ncbi:hypothetical protein LPB86_01620 [Pedobacter sp. MC2016-14]|uniref:hypothetical protein n=1 Tax=Pedobacter sp. MC2016-14 TaxID=2897327 RepID=UPI001E54EB39|nr:hypothetical protein [Pedobacter sp. MC2016-14]MCD0486907.1 hypothetical protein [Pedobacter sp. MC2016-14]
MEYDVIFYYPQHFNRSKAGTNPFFDPLIKICEDFNISFLLIEEPDKNTAAPRNSKAYQFDFWLFLILSFRKLIPGFFFKTSRHRDRFIGKLISRLSFRKFSARNYITISNSMINCLSAFNDQAKVYDLQHGIIYSWHHGYFNADGSLKEELNSPNLGFLVYGAGFLNEFSKGNENSLNHRVKVIGNVLKPLHMEVAVMPEKNLNKVVYSLQFTRDWDVRRLEDQREELFALLESVEATFLKFGLVFYLKHHPRFGNCINLSTLSERFKFVEFINPGFYEPDQEPFLHVTIYSTVAFDYAEKGIPTYFVQSKSAPEGKMIYLDKYAYPCVYPSLSEMITVYLTDHGRYMDEGLKVMEWQKNFYADFDAKQFLNILSFSGNENLKGSAHVGEEN